MFCTYIHVMCTLARAYVFVGAHVHLCIYLFMMGLWFWSSSISGCLIYCLVLFQGQDCFICKKSGHRAKDCPEKYKGGSLSLKICLKCGDSGHDMFSCYNDYSPDNLKVFFPFPSFIPKETEPVILPFFSTIWKGMENKKISCWGRQRDISG